MRRPSLIRPRCTQKLNSVGALPSRASTPPFETAQRHAARTLSNSSSSCRSTSRSPLLPLRESAPSSEESEVHARIRLPSDRPRSDALRPADAPTDANCCERHPCGAAICRQARRARPEAFCDGARGFGRKPSIENRQSRQTLALDISQQLPRLIKYAFNAGMARGSCAINGTQQGGSFAQFGGDGVACEYTRPCCSKL